MNKDNGTLISLNLEAIKWTKEKHS
jgi:hypothetical protein